MARYTAAVIYGRVSTADQAKSGLGREAQLAKCREHCARNGWEVAAEHFDDGISGREDVEGRPELGRALAALSKGRVLVSYSLSRLSRSQRITWSLLDDRGGRGIPFSSASEAFDTSTPMGRAMLGMIGVWSQLEADAVSERTRDALAAAKARGVRLGALSMIERWEADGINARGRAKYKRVVDREKVSLVRTVQRMADEQGPFRTSLVALADELNRQGIASPNGKRWHPRTVKVALETELP